MLLATRCPFCRRCGPAPCAPCAAALRPCGTPFLLGAGHWCAAALLYSHGGREVVAALKFRGDRSALRWCAAAVGGLLDPGMIDMLTWAPTSPARARRRGADQAETLARAVGREIGMPVRPLLRRLAGPAQANRTREDRRAGVRFAATADLRGLRVAVLDDVITTGATLRAACIALREGGAASVCAVALARAERTQHPQRVAFR